MYDVFIPKGKGDVQKGRKKESPQTIQNRRLHLFYGALESLEVQGHSQMEAERHMIDLERHRCHTRVGSFGGIAQNHPQPRGPVWQVSRGMDTLNPRKHLFASMVRHFVKTD